MSYESGALKRLPEGCGLIQQSLPKGQNQRFARSVGLSRDRPSSVEPSNLHCWDMLASKRRNSASLWLVFSSSPMTVDVVLPKPMRKRNQFGGVPLTFVKRSLFIDIGMRKMSTMLVGHNYEVVFLLLIAFLERYVVSSPTCTNYVFWCLPRFAVPYYFVLFIPFSVVKRAITSILLRLLFVRWLSYPSSISRFLESCPLFSHIAA